MTTSRPGGQGARPRSPRAAGVSAPSARTRRGTSRITSLRPAADAVASGESGWTARAAVLGLVVVVLAVTLAWPVTLVLRQRGDLNDLAARERAAEAKVARLETRLASLDDPAVVEAEARARLGWSREGETSWVVLGDGSDPVAPRLTDGPRDEVEDGTPWWERLLSEADGRPTDDPAAEPDAVAPGAAVPTP